mgnify:CR=1 FL=1
MGRTSRGCRRWGGRAAAAGDGEGEGEEEPRPPEGEHELQPLGFAAGECEREGREMVSGSFVVRPKFKISSVNSIFLPLLCLKWKCVEYHFCSVFRGLQLLCYANFHLKLTFWTICTFANLHKRTLVLSSFWLDFGKGSIENMSIEVPLMSQLKFCAHFWIEIWVAFHSFFFLL